MTIYFNVDRDRYTGALQLSVSEINEEGMGLGRRIAGPKYAGDSISLLAQKIDSRDAEAIIEILRKAL